ncbi:oxygenase MpaB family protein [Jongsikchunia kroppenstedtii]|uniref:oxygenase MpaB family protein n=1 Tax=Jongsikchunia kroppenstedtii TaxID=1121721 RepID=UPI0003730343|nr:oxygenase MpaB family protein [Jongsikchunia kroppenstedtii]
MTSLAYSDADTRPASDLPDAGRLRIDSLVDLSTWIWPWLPAANVVMQLAHPGVGYGVYESPVKSGRADLRPIKRGRTTAMYLAVATLGTDADKKFVHDEVHKIHAQVYSREKSPVKYSGNSIPLQRWVALCLVRYFVDQYESVHGPLSLADKDRVIEVAAPLATTLNVPAKAWPNSWHEYETEFAKGLADVRIDAPVRQYLQELSTFRVLEVRTGKLGVEVSKVVGPWNLAATKYGVPQEVRDAMGWTITPGDRRRYELICKMARLGDRVLPRSLRGLYTVYLWDLRTRRRLGLSVY